MIAARASGKETAVGYSFSSIDELGEGYGFRKVRRAMGVTAFGVNAIVYPPGQEGFLHYHERQDELYFVHSGRGVFEVDGETRELGPGGLCHVEAQTPRKVSNPSADEDLVMLVVGGKGGYVERDGMLVDPERDLARRQAFGG
jgi:mannose-6-phosphate isomerase-like protein (cupin superfamily)